MMKSPFIAMIMAFPTFTPKTKPTSSSPRATSHAQDRFWQMEFWRHTGQGRISEIVGEATLDNDKFIRTMGWNRMAETTAAYYEEEEPEYYAILEAYSAGVNAYIEENRDNLSVNQTILELVGEPWEIEPWTPVNTVAWGVVMSV